MFTLNTVRLRGVTSYEPAAILSFPGIPVTVNLDKKSLENTQPLCAFYY